MGIGNLGFGEIVFILLILLLVFGARRLPEIGQSLGKGIREFKKSMSEISGEFNNAAQTPPQQPPQYAPPMQPYVPAPQPPIAVAPPAVAPQSVQAAGDAAPGVPVTPQPPASLG